MAKGSNFKLAYKRRREGKTDYHARLKLIDLDKPRLVARISNANVIAQIIVVGEDGDETLVSAHTKEIQKMGWLAGSKNTSIAYLTGYLCGKKALAKGIENAVLDIGLKSSIKGAKVFAVLKGASDAGLNIPHGESILPDENRITGQHIADYAGLLNDDDAKKQFSQYFEKGINPVDLPKHFEEIKNKIDEAEV